jgi:hypothetical protein
MMITYTFLSEVYTEENEWIPLLSVAMYDSGPLYRISGSRSPLKVSRRIRRICRFHLQGRRIGQAKYQREAGSKQSLKMDATYSSETSVNFQQTTRPYIPEDRALLDHFILMHMSYWKTIWDKAEDKRRIMMEQWWNDAEGIWRILYVLLPLQSRRCLRKIRPEPFPTGRIAHEPPGTKPVQTWWESSALATQSQPVPQWLCSEGHRNDSFVYKNLEILKYITIMEKHELFLKL